MSTKIGPILVTGAAGFIGAAVAERLAGAPELPVFSTAPLAAFPGAAIALPRAALLARLAARGVGILAEGDFEPLYLREPLITQPKVRPLGV